ncbi:Alanine--tRNA ligase [Euphorbia peplus]|nr:Alanine--tRNA ligase [Euphorbia peplus]
MIISHGKPVDPDHLRKIECIVNNQIKAELEVYAKEATVSEAKQINGLRAVFGEVYPDPVRVVSIGQKFAYRDCGAGLAGVNLVAGLTFAALSLSGVVQKLKISEDDRPLRAFMTVDLIIMDVISTAS